MFKRFQKGGWLDKSPSSSDVFSWSVAVISMLGLLLSAPICGCIMVTKTISFALNSIRDGSFSYGTGISFAARVGFCYYCFVIEWRILQSCFTKYHFSADGIEAYFLRKVPKVYPWTIFQEVCICYEDNHAKSNEKKQKLICFVQKGEQKNFFGFWKVGAFWRYPRIIRLNYTSKLFDEITDVCPFQIVNHCK